MNNSIKDQIAALEQERESVLVKYANSEELRDSFLKFLDGKIAELKSKLSYEPIYGENASFKLAITHCTGEVQVIDLEGISNAMMLLSNLERYGSWHGSYVSCFN